MMVSEKLMRKGIEDLSALGAMPCYALVALLMLALGDGELFVMLLAGALVSYAVVFGIRLAYFKERPRREPHTGLLERLDASSFPSLHAYRATMLAALLGYLYPSWEMGALLCAYALAVMATRVLLRRHDIWDLLCGAALGALTAWGLLAFL